MVMHPQALRLVILTIPFFAPPAVAHHSFAKFDQNKVNHVRATVRDFEWTNPHTWLHAELVETSGAVMTWSFEGGSPEQLASLGWKPGDFHAGDKIEIGFRPMKDGSRGGQLMSAKLANGQNVCSNRGCGDGNGGILVGF
jgi:hypothetical protein